MADQGPSGAGVTSGWDFSAGEPRLMWPSRPAATDSAHGRIIGDEWLNAGESSAPFRGGLLFATHLDRPDANYTPAECRLIKSRLAGILAAAYQLPPSSTAKPLITSIKLGRSERLHVAATPKDLTKEHTFIIMTELGRIDDKHNSQRAHEAPLEPVVDWGQVLAGLRHPDKDRQFDAAYRLAVSELPIPAKFTRQLEGALDHSSQAVVALVLSALSQIAVQDPDFQLRNPDHVGKLAEQPDPRVRSQAIGLMRLLNGASGSGSLITPSVDESGIQNGSTPYALEESELDTLPRIPLREAARRLGVKVESLQKLAQKGKFGKKPGRDWLASEWDIAAYSANPPRPGPVPSPAPHQSAS